MTREPRPGETVALGFRAHSGWSAVTVVAGSPSAPRVIERRRIETAASAVPGSRQPFHAAEPRAFREAEALIRRCRESSSKLAYEAVAAIGVGLQREGYRIAACGLLTAAGRPLPDLAAILKSHALIHTAEGEFFREVLIRACESLSLPVVRIKEKEVWDRAAALFGTKPDSLREQIGSLGRTLGPPWTQDEKLASLAAWIALADPP